MTGLRVSIESWGPEYGSPLDDGAFEPSAVTVDPTVELPVERWRPIAPPEALAPAGSVVFVDGVRRIDAQAWIASEGSVTARRGLCASYAAGVVRTAELARVEAIEVRRAIFSGVAIEPLVTRAGAFAPMAAAGEDLDALVLALQQRLGQLEIDVATAIDPGADLVVVDGPLSGRQHVPGAIGYVKTHRVAYLDESLQGVVSRLAPGERSPLFVSTTSWTRYSWYLRLPGPSYHPWSGIVRIETSGDRPAVEAAQVADLSARTLPRYASVPHKDPRAPQNLFPIAGLERELRHRLGDAALVHRALREATAVHGNPPLIQRT